MHYLNFLYPALVASSAFIDGAAALRSNRIKLSNVQSLTLRKDQQTSHRRVPSVPQLKCVGGSGCRFYEVDIMRCKNEGYDYDAEDIQWKCMASLPDEFKLGSTDVICEGYDSRDDPYVLKGSCGVEYRLLLTDKGEEKYGHKKPWFGGGDDDDVGREGPQSFAEKLAGALFWLIFIGVALYILWSAVSGWAAQRGMNGGAGNRPGWGGGGGGGGGWGGNDDPPPPYDWNPSQNPPQNPKNNYGTTQGWRPGFWSGALGGAAAAYAAGRAGSRNNRTTMPGWGNSGMGYDNGEGSSRGSSSSPSYSSTRHESTGFGSTSRR